MGISVETVKTDAFSMDYVRFGSGKRTFVILPGLSVQSVMGARGAVAQAYDALTREFTVYLFDRRKELPAAYTVADMADDTAAAMRALGLKDVSLFGASQGGMIAQCIAIAHPDLIETLILGSTTARLDASQFGIFDRWIDLAKRGDAEGLYLAFGEAVYPKAFFEKNRNAFAALAKGVTGGELSRFTLLAESMRGFDVRDRLKEIACPVLVLGAKDDAVLAPDAAQMYADAFGGREDCTIYEYDGYGHAAFDMAPDYRERMLRFLTRPLALRAHHGMCMRFFEGRGYSEAFTDRMRTVIATLSERPQTPVRLTASTDAICLRCPNNAGGACTSSEKVRRYDEAVLSLCDLKAGDELPYAAFAERVKARILDQGLRETVCGDCEWDGVCTLAPHNP